MRRHPFLRSLAATLTVPCVPGIARADAPATSLGTPTVSATIRNEFAHAWGAYRKFAWGHDEVKPISGKPTEFFLDKHPFGLSIIEALDTLYVMGMDNDVKDCVAWIKANLDYDVDGEVEMFEAVIRMVAGLLTGYYITSDRFFVDKARDLADRLLPCFTKSPSGAPYRFVNLRTGAVRDAKSNLAEIGSNILEFGELSRLTGDSKYHDVSMKAYRTILAARSSRDLLGTHFDVEKNAFVGTEDVAPNPPADSFYEYLWNAWLLFGNKDTRDWYNLLTDAMVRDQVVRVNGHVWFQIVDYTTGKPTGKTTAVELAAFYPEILAKSGRREVGEAFYDSWTTVSEKYGLIPAEIDYRDLSVVDGSYDLFPEYPNAAFDLWFFTHDAKYRRTALQHFNALRSNCRTAEGYTTIDDVRTTPMKQADYFPAYAFSENFKYLYLMFAGSPRFDGANYVLNTEGKVLRGLRKP